MSVDEGELLEYAHRVPNGDPRASHIVEEEVENLNNKTEKNNDNNSFLTDLDGKFTYL